MNIETLVVGPLETNCYILSDPVSREAVVIDAGDDGDSIWQVIQQKQLQVKYILNTHGHFDHIQANDSLRDKTGAPLAIHADDAELLLAPEKVSAGMYMQVNGCREPEILLHNGDVILLAHISCVSFIRRGTAGAAAAFMKWRRRFALPEIRCFGAVSAVLICMAAIMRCC